ncbi:MAG: PIG-L family deacetylase, partial [Kofleriaceae bacterium]
MTCARASTMGGRLAWSSVAALGALAACGDNHYLDGEPLAPATDLTIIAHEDDDLLFMQPDLDEAILRGAGVTNVYVTAGDAGRGYGRAEERYEGLKAAYGSLVGDLDWTCGWIERDGHRLEHCRLEAERFSLVFVEYPDGGRKADLGHGLLQLWQGDVTAATTVGRRPSSYDRTQLIALIAHIIDDTAPTTLRTLDLAATHGDAYADHPDHELAGAVALVATAASTRAPALIAYRGYNIENEPANASAAVLARSLARLAYYEACDSGCAPCGEPCAIERLPPSHVTYQARRYAIGMQRAGQGQLRQGDRCLDAADQPALGDCATAPTWRLDPQGALRASTGRCLVVQP